MKFSTIINSTGFRTYQNVLKFAWTAASAKLGQKVAKKLGCGSTGQKVGAIAGAVGYSALLAKCEQLCEKTGCTNKDIAEWMDSCLEGYSEPDADEIWDEFIDSVSDLDHPKDVEAQEA